ncbi:MAG: hypothetical protein WC565_02260 [Parcubacteria group bacterium]
MQTIFQKIFLEVSRHGIALAAGEGSDSGSGLPSFTIVNPLNLPAGDPATLIDGIINGLLWIVIPVAALMYLWAGFLFLTSGGNDEKVKQARKTVLWTSVGVAAIVLSKAVEVVIRNLLTV